MEELKLLVEMVASLPEMALWVIAFFFAYKVMVIGSIYGLIRFGIDRLHSWLMKPGSVYKKIVEVEHRFRSICISHDSTMDDLYAQICRLKGKATSINSDYLHSCSVRWLAEAIDEKEQREREARQKKAAVA